ncbi:response regulator [Vibrio sp. 404]|uniref:Response regulator n=1 Tax=Vibrio marinisediminis TaxID=2758441 RepID=A0A7W2FMK4_9VIBR|nr:response regulator [Vibrio marinisediminis]MBA5760789.1 response regulator [Vibrio marinisediminis]
MQKINTSFLKNWRVLVVDDSSTALLLIKQQLVSLGVPQNNITTVERYQVAIKAMQTHQFDVLILDYHLEQHLTGYELAMLLHRNRLISNATGVLIISGDARQETVLTALSGKVRHFITKPLSNASLAEKLHTIYREMQKLAQITDALQSGNKLSAATMFELINRSGFSVSLEAYLLEYLMTNNQWEFLDIYITISSTPCHASKMCTIAYLLHRDNNTKQALEELHSFLTENPLSIRVMDVIADIYEQSQQTEKAALWATKAFELTPSIGERAARASQFNMQAHKRAQLMKVGHLYSQHISLADINWLKTVIVHFHSLQSIYTLTESTSAKTEIMQHANDFFRFARHKLTPKRLQHLKAVVLLSHSHVLIHENNEMLAHQKLLKSLSQFYDELFECPPVLLIEYLPALAFFGERQIYSTITDVLKSRGINNFSEMVPAPYIAASQSSGHSSQPTHQEQSDVSLEHYPHSSEAKIQFLYRHSSQPAIGDSSKIDAIVSELAVLDLPPNWHNWLITGKQHSFKIAPPVAFSLFTRDQKGA